MMLRQAFLVAILPACLFADAPREVSGIYPSLAMFNAENECGVGAVVPWADRLWVITYAPHEPYGSSDKLYEITPELQQIVRPESVGGTPANRMIHEDSGQLLIGPYLIDREGQVRGISPLIMPGRLTGTARHLTNPAGKAYYATMEEGLYEVDVKTLEVKCLIRNGEFYEPPAGVSSYDSVAGSDLPGYHGKGLYSGQGRLIYANNGERSKQAQIDPATPSGALAEWKGDGDWQLVRRNQFTEVTGPGGIRGSADAMDDPVWTIGWDSRSLLLMMLDKGTWHSFRLPKASHCYDGAHGWNTEWPRIRDIGEEDLLMTMHGMFWRFPRGFGAASSAGLRPRSTYLKLIGDFCRWNYRLVFGCDDTAKSEFLNKRPVKGETGGPGQSQSNLWFTAPETPDHLGPVIARGGVWINDRVQADQWSEPFLLEGFSRRSLFLRHEGPEAVRFDLQIDRLGNGKWEDLRSVDVPAGQPAWLELGSEVKGEWIRLRTDRDSPRTTAYFQYAGRDDRPAAPADIFDGLARLDDNEAIGGFLRTRGGDLRTLGLVVTKLGDGVPSPAASLYELDADLRLKSCSDPDLRKELNEVTAIPRGIVRSDEASAIYVDAKGKRWRLPGDKRYTAFNEVGVLRLAREVCTERDLFNCQGTFYELPAENAGGIAKVRPISTHGLKIQDYCSYRGLLVLTGVDGTVRNERIVRSEDGRAAVWLGVADDLWKMGKPRGTGGPWNRSEVRAKEASDPYLMTGFDRKSLHLRNDGPEAVTLAVEADATGEGSWAAVKSFDLAPGESVHHEFPDWFQACWVRLISSVDTMATAQFTYD